MRHRLIGLFSAAFLACWLPSGVVSQSVLAQSQPAAAQATEDVIHMQDGRVLHGKILNETRLLIIFEYTDAVLKATTKLTLSKDEVALIERGVAVTAAPQPSADPSKTTTSTSTAKKATPTEPVRTYGTSRATEPSADAAKIYIVPMKGQMGTDINSEIYKKIVSDIRALKPDIIVIQMFCQDTEDKVFSEKTRADAGLLEFDEYRMLVSVFKEELRDVRQVCWVEDSVGISSMVAMTWSDIYMKPTARFGGLGVAHTGMFTIPDLDVRGKMVAALMGFVKSFLEYGKYSLVLADAMVQPDQSLSASWKGREVIWSLDDRGEYLVDGNDKRTANFRSKDAENLCLSKGTADTLEDLALLLGYREHAVVPGQAEKLCEEYVKDWRRAYEEIKVLYMDYQQFLGWATGQDAIKYLGRAITTLEKILNYIERFKPLEIRLAQEFGVTKGDLIVLIEQHKEQLRALRRGGNAGGGGGGGPTPGRGSGG